MFGELGPKIQVLQNFLKNLGFFSDYSSNLFFTPGSRKPYANNTDVTGNGNQNNIYIGSGWYGNSVSNFRPAGNADGNTAAQNNVVVGAGAGGKFTSAGNNVCVGSQAGTNMTTAQGNVAIGGNALVGQSTGSGYSVAVGYAALQNESSSGGLNVAMGYTAGQTVTSGAYNVCLGYAADVSANNSTNRVALGRNSSCTVDNTIQLGDSSITVVTCGTGNTSSVKALNAAKWYVKANTAGAIQGTSFNVTSLTDTGTGDIGVTIATDHADVNYVATGTAERTASTATATFARDVSIKAGTQAAGSISFECWDKTATTNVIKDPTMWHLIGWGTQ